MFKRVSLWRSTPPAIFPVMLGFMGLSHAWRNVAHVLPVPTVIGDLMLGFAVALFLFFAVSYGMKVIVRPKALLEDLNSPPARAGVAALPMTLMIMAAGLLSLGADPEAIWWVGIVLYFLTSALILVTVLKGPPEARRLSPFQFLAFVGMITGPVAGIPLGHDSVSFWLAMIAMVPYLVITLGYYPKLLKRRPPVPLRPSLAIVLAPTGLFAIAFGQLGMDLPFQIFYWAAYAIALVLMLAAPWLTEDGWTPVWGSLTFPAAVFLNMQILAVGKGMGIIAMTGLIAGGLIATPMILYILYKALRFWMTGDMAKKTGASVA